MCFSGWDGIRRRPASSDIPGLEVAGSSTEVGAAAREAGASATRSARWSPAAATRSTASAPAPQCLPVAARPRARRRGGDSRNVLHRLDQRVRARPAAGRASRSWSTAAPAASARRRFNSRGRSGRACSPPPVRRRSARPASGSGPSACINYRDADFVAVVRELTGGRGVDVVLDMVGGDYFARNIDVLAPEGRLVRDRDARRASRPS